MKKTILFFMMICVAVSCCWVACSNLTEPSRDNIKQYFIEECMGGVEVESLSDFRKNTHINFELVTTVKKGKRLDYHYRAEVQYLIDGYSFRKDQKQYYEGIVSFIKDEEGWTPQSATVYGHRCRH